MKGLYLLVVGLLLYIKTSSAEVSFRLQAPPPPQQPPRSRFNFGRFQPMVDAIFSRNKRYRRPAFQHHSIDTRPFNAKPPPIPVMKPLFHSSEQNHYHNLPKKVPAVPFPPPPPPHHLLPDESLAYLQDGFGAPRPHSIIQMSSLKKGNLELVPELKPLEANGVTNGSIQDAIFPQPLIETNTNQFLPVIKPPLPRKLMAGNANQQNFEHFVGGNQLNSALVALDPVQLDPEAILHFVDNQPTFFNAEPLKPSTIIQSQVNNDDSSLDASSINGLRPPPFEEGNGGSLQGLTFHALAPESQFSSVSEPFITGSFFPVTDHEPADNGVELDFPNSFPVANAGILPLANELPDEMQKFPPFT